MSTPDHDRGKMLRQIMGLAPLRDPLPDEMPALEKIKVYAREGFASGYHGTPEDFERIWQEAFPDTEMEKGGK